MGKKTANQKYRQALDRAGLAAPEPSKPAGFAAQREKQQAAKLGQIGKGVKFGQGRLAARVKRGKR